MNNKPACKELEISVTKNNIAMSNLLRAGSLPGDTCSGHFNPRAIILTNLVEVK